MPKSLAFQYSKHESDTQLDLSHLDTTGVTDMSWMFEQCYCLQRLDLSTFDFSQVTEMQGMFSECGNLKEVIFSDTVNSAGHIPHYTSTYPIEYINQLWKETYISSGPQVADITVNRLMEKTYVSFSEATQEEKYSYLGLHPSAKITIVPHRSCRK